MTAALILYAAALILYAAALGLFVIFRHHDICEASEQSILRDYTKQSLQTVWLSTDSYNEICDARDLFINRGRK